MDPDNKENQTMSDADRRIADAIAQTVVSRILSAVQDKETAGKVMEVWGGEIDRTIGRGLRRALWYLALVLGGIASVKLGLLEKALGWLK